MPFLIDPHIKGCRERDEKFPVHGAPNKYLDYKSLTEELKNLGFTIKNYEKPGDSPIMILGKYHIWQCREGWAIAELIGEYLRNHQYFNSGEKPYGWTYGTYTEYTEKDLERAINHVMQVHASQGQEKRSYQ